MAKAFKKLAGWKAFKRVISAKTLDTKTKEEVRKANGRIALEGVRIAREVIQGGAFAVNANLTQELKGHARPLTDTGAWLWRQVTYQELSPMEFFIGVLMRTPRYNIVQAIHEGAAVKVTEKMRFMFRALWRASRGRLDPSELRGGALRLWRKKKTGWLPLREDTTVINIPRRPFMEAVFLNEKFIAFAKREWEGALKTVLSKA